MFLLLLTIVNRVSFLVSSELLHFINIYIFAGYCFLDIVFSLMIKDAGKERKEGGTAETDIHR